MSTTLAHRGFDGLLFAPAPEHDRSQPAPALEDPPPAWLRSGVVPSLDGLRASAVGVVLAAHFCGHSDFARDYPAWVGTFGRMGVDLFFVLSGFLITLLLLRERDRTGGIDVRAFYTRRALRIFPAYYAYLAALAVLALAGAVSVGRGSWFGAATYTTNFAPGLGSWETAHFFSLAIEEHFYLLWPLVLVRLGRRAVVALVAVLVLSPVARLVTVLAVPDSPVHPVHFHTWNRLDGIGWGCALAMAATAGRLGFLNRRPLAWAVGLLTLVVGSWAVLPLLPLAWFAPYYTLHAVCLAGLLWLAATNPDSAVGRVLNSAPLVRVGVLSYSIYVWQQLFCKPTGSEWWQGGLVGLSLALAAAVCSHYLIERPFLRLKDRLGRSR